MDLWQNQGANIVGDKAEEVLEWQILVDHWKGFGFCSV